MRKIDDEGVSPQSHVEMNHNRIFRKNLEYEWRNKGKPPVQQNDTPQPEGLNKPKKKRKNASFISKIETIIRGVGPNVEKRRGEIHVKEKGRRSHTPQDSVFADRRRP